MLSLHSFFSDENSIKTLFAVLFGVVFMCVILDGKKPFSAAACCQFSLKSLGMIIEILTFSADKSLHFLKKSLQLKLSL